MPLPPEETSAEESAAEVGRLRRRLEREHRARLESENIAERATTELFEMVGALQRSKAVLDETPDFVAIADLDGDVSYLNRAFQEMLGILPGDVDGINLWDLLDSTSRGVVSTEAMPALEDKGLWRGELAVLRPTGTAIPVSQVLIGHRQGDGRIVSLSSISRDITERHEMAARLTQQAMHDPLTGLPNRLLILDRLQQALVRSTRERCFVGVLFLDLDRFKLVNDGLGHAAGDDLLRLVARRITAAVRATDTVGRLGGDEFIVICDGLANSAEAEQLARVLTEALSLPAMLGQDEVFVSASVGIVLGDGTESAEDLIQGADEAMYQAKREGRGRYEVFSEGLRANAAERLQTERDLHRALDAGEMALHYQPIVALPGGRLVGVEALLRWRHPERGLLLPGAFIDLVEDSGLIVPIGEWVIEEACRQVASWRRETTLLGELQVAVNLSARQLLRPGLATVVEKALAATGIAPASLVFELTESIMMEVEGPTMTELRRIKDLGAELGIDDFGIGYSSLTYLKRFPVDFFKVDKSFVDGLGVDARDEAITDALLCLGRGLGLRVIAEGVETTVQRDHLAALGCEFAQGFLFATPQEPDAIAALASRPTLSEQESGPASSNPGP